MRHVVVKYRQAVQVALKHKKACTQRSQGHPPLQRSLQRLGALYGGQTARDMRCVRVCAGTQKYLAVCCQY